MFTTSIIISLVISYLSIGIFLSIRYWKLIKKADKIYTHKIQALLLSVALNREYSLERRRELSRLESEHRELKVLLEGKCSGFFTIAMVYTTTWPIIILSGDDLYDTDQQS